MNKLQGELEQLLISKGRIENGCEVTEYFRVTLHKQKNLCRNYVSFCLRNVRLAHM